jgi:Na+/H+-dicarboxylate symporter
LFPDVAAELKPLGDAFISLIRMTIAPLMFLVAVTGLAQVGNMRAAVADVVVAKWDGDFDQVAWAEASADL